MERTTPPRVQQSIILSSDRVTCFKSAHLISYSSDSPDLSSSELLRLAIGDECQSVQPACINFSAFVGIFFSATFCALSCATRPLKVNRAELYLRTPPDIVYAWCIDATLKMMRPCSRNPATYSKSIGKPSSKPQIQ